VAHKSSAYVQELVGLVVGHWRVFYRLDGARVLVTLIGEKRGAALVVEGEELKL
jgi:hypothetical protein